MPCRQVKISSKLSGPTYTIIVSLAVADLLLGLLVLPLSAVYEVSLYRFYVWESLNISYLFISN